MIPLYTHAIAAAAAAAIAFGGAWWAQGARYDAKLSKVRADHAATLQTIADKTARAAQLVRAREDEIRTALAEQDTRHHEELTHARKETNRLRACVRDGTCGVRLAADSANARPGSAATCPGSMGDGAGNLAAGVQSRVLDLRESVHTDAAKLAYLQEYARACWRAGTQEVAPQ